MQGLIMDMPLMISAAMRHAADFHGKTEVVARTIEGDIHRYDYATAHARMQQLANALGRLGIQPGDRVGSLAWNTHRHFEMFYGVSGTGAVLHTINPRLFADQLVYIINHAEDRLLFVDAATLPVVEAIAPRLTHHRALRDDVRAFAHAAQQQPAEPAVLRRAAGGGSPRTTTGPISTSAVPPRCATPPAPPATPRACSIRTARRCWWRCSSPASPRWACPTEPR